MPMLRKVISIQHVGRFRSSASTPNPQLAKLTLIFGANGFGKTTLCAILQSLQSGEASHILGRRTLGTNAEPFVDLLIDAGNAQFRAGVWTRQIPEVTIFDSSFIAENVHSGDVVDVEHRRGLYRVIIGREGVALAVEEERLAGESRDKAGKIRAAEGAVARLIPAGVEIADFLKFPPDLAIDDKITEQQRTLEAAREGSHIKERAGLKDINVPTLPARLAPVLVQSLDSIAADAERKIATHLVGHGMSGRGQAWVAEGMGYTAGDTCPFCGRPLETLDLIAAYRAVLSNAYAALKDDVTALRQEINDGLGDRAVGMIETQIEQNRGGLEFWGRYCTIDAADLTAPAGLAAAISRVHQSAVALLDRKASAPLEMIAPDETFTEAVSAYGEICEALRAYNQAVKNANARIEARRAAAGSADVKTAEAKLARLRAIKARHESGGVAACAAYAKLCHEKDEIETAKVAVRAKLNVHTEKVIKPYEARINDYLERFNAGFRIAQTKHIYSGGQATSSYQIVINETAVGLGDAKTPAGKPCFANTLSAGDRSTLALAFFLTHLDQDRARASRIVVFDDPFTSQDAFRRQWTVHEIKKTSLACAQVIVLSHDAGFLRQVWDKCATDQRVALQIADQGEQGCKIMVFNLDDACKGRAASEMDDLIAYQASGAGKPRDMIKKMRIVLETYCRATYPGYFTGDDNLGDVIGKIRIGGEAHPAWALHDRLDVINDYSAQHHHGEDPSEAAPADHIDEAELKGFIRLTLKIANNLQA